MALPGSGNPISFNQINTELGNSSTNANLSLRAASNTFGESTPDSISELYGKAFNTTFTTTFANFNMDVDYNWGDSGTVLAEKQVVLDNGTGNTTITCSTPSNSAGTLKVKVGTSSGNYNLDNSFGTSSTVTTQTSYFIQFQFVATSDVEDDPTINSTATVTIANNGVSFTRTISFIVEMTQSGGGS